MSGVIISAGEGKEIQALGMGATLLAVARDRGGRVEILESEFPPGLALPAHTHRENDEAFYMIEGELRARVGDQTFDAAKGSFGFAPRGVAHGLENKGASAARFVLVQVPGIGNERLLEEPAALPPGPPDMEQMMGIFSKYDFEMAPPG